MTTSKGIQLRVTIKWEAFSDPLMRTSLSLFISAVMLTSLLFGMSQSYAESSLENEPKFSGKISAADAWVTSAGGSGSDMAWDMVLDSQGNSYVTGSFSGSATFGSTTLNSIGGIDGFVAKMDNLGNWVWASQIAGSHEDWGAGIDIDSNGNVYVTGPFINNQDSTSPSVQLGSHYLNAHSQSTYDMFVGKLDSSGNWAWAETSNKIEELDLNTYQYVEQFGQVLTTDIKVFNNSITISGSYNGKIFAYTDSQGDWYYESSKDSSGFTTTDAYVGFLDLDGTWGSQHGWGGSSQSDAATAVASSPTGDYWYIAGSFANTVEFIGGTTITSSGGSPRYLDNANYRWWRSRMGNFCWWNWYRHTP
ncbi:MAG TPA: SBBP repeat-containing protein [Candidatus Thalassarchaeaceae archaeon]|nr:SBBP repeat-containing protein [Candidatus Thalassarchaeaceae archaeon]